MAKDSTIKTRLTLDGEKEFKQKIREINQELRLGNAQLKETAAAYDLNGNAQDKLAANSRILKEQLDTQNRIVQEYEQRLKQAKNATDLSAQGLRNYEIELTNARTKQKQLEKAVESADRELEEIGRDSRRAGDQLEDNLGDAADEVGDKFDRMVQKIQDDLGDLRGMQTISLGVDIARGASDVLQQLWNWYESDMDYNMRKSQTTSNYKAAGGTNTEEMMRQVIRYTAVFGDEDGAMEAISNLAAAGIVDEQLADFSRYIGGLGIKFRDTYKVESLAEEARKTLETGTAEGQFAEALQALNVNIEDFNKAMQASVENDAAEGRIDMGQRYATMIAYLRGNTEQDIGAYWDAYVDENKALIEASEAAVTLKDAMADLSSAVGIELTPVIQGLAKVIKEITGMFKEPENDYGPTETEAEAAEKAAEKHGVRVDIHTPVVYVGQEEIQKTKYQTELEKAKAIAAGEVWEAEPAQQKDWIQDLEDRTRSIPLIGDLLANIFLPSHAGGESATGKPNAIMSAYVTAIPDEAEVEQTAKEINQEIIDAAADGLAAGAMSLVEGLNAQTGPLMAIAEMQREMLAEVWRDPITPTVVVGYASTGGKPNLPPVTGPSQVNVTVELDKRPLGQVMVDLADQGLAGADGGAFGAMVNKYDW